MLWLRRTAYAVLVPGAVLCASAALAATPTRRKLDSIVPRVGIGVVRLGEPRASVELALGTGRLQRRGTYSGSYAYRSGRITVLVTYGLSRVIAIDTLSRSALLYHRQLREGLIKLRPVFIKHHWQILTCLGETFTDLGQGGPGTGIAWRNGRLDYVQLDAGGSVGDACLPAPLSVLAR